MRINNPNNLPDVLVRAAIGDYDRRPNPNRMSVTDLINPPMIRHLKIKHWDDIEVDIDDLAWALFGKAFHDLMHRYSGPAISEEKIEQQIGSLVLVGQPDVHLDGVLDDYKVTSVWSFIYGDKPEWESQLNIYRYLLFAKGILITEARIIAILRDWVKTKKVQPDYPRSPFHVADIPLWPIPTTLEYINKRLVAHAELELCTPDDKWQRDTTYAVIGDGKKKASRVLDSEEAAQEWATANMKGKYDIVLRRGERIRCGFYCLVKDVCPYSKEADDGSNREMQAV